MFPPVVAWRGTQKVFKTNFALNFQTLICHRVFVISMDVFITDTCLGAMSDCHFLTNFVSKILFRVARCVNLA